METEYNYEMFRSDTNDFYEDFGEYLNLKKKDHWNVKNCTFFDKKDKEKLWAWCLFEKKSDQPG